MVLLAASMPFGASLGEWGADTPVWLAISTAVAQTGGYAVRIVRLSLRLQEAVDSVDDAEIMVLLPPGALPEARRWIVGDECDVGKLTLVVPLAALHVALGRCGVGIRRERALVAG